MDSRLIKNLLDSLYAFRALFLPYPIILSDYLNLKNKEEVELYLGFRLNGDLDTIIYKTDSFIEEDKLSLTANNRGFIMIPMRIWRHFFGRTRRQMGNIG